MIARMGSILVWTMILGIPLTTSADDPSASADALKSISPDEVSGLTVDPPTVRFDHARAVQRVLVTAKVGDREVDVTDQVRWESSDESITRVTEQMEVIPVGDGSAQVTCHFGSHQVAFEVSVANAGTPRTISFTNEIEPILSKLTCNSGGCHGKSGGQNGFRLSLLGFQPEADYDALVKEARGRRLFPADPPHSLLLRKGTGQLPHGGGKRWAVGDPNHQLIVDWIQQGMPYGAEDPVVTKIDIEPQTRVMSPHQIQRLRVSATYSDGRIEDVTRQVQFQSNDESIATIDEAARVTTQGLSGEAAIMARYMGQVAVFRPTVPVPMPAPESVEFVEVGPIDHWTRKKWDSLGLVPSPPAGDHEFIRRLTIDLCGRLPTPDEVNRFVASTESDKRARLADELLDSMDYASHFAMKWGALLQNRRAGNGEYVIGTHAMSLWLKDAFHQDMPYDQFVRDILTATGTPEENPPVTWYRQVRTPEQNVDNVTQLFLGTRIQCAQCHHHPFEKWGQDDYYSFAAFFSRVGRKKFDVSGSDQATEAVFVQRDGSVKHPNTGKVMSAAGLDGEHWDVPPGEDPRGRLVDWMTEPGNPFFARALVNRVWGHFFGRGIVEPIDDMRVTNPPTNPELLDGLAAIFRDSGYRIKPLIRAIVNSSTYQRASEPNDFNRDDRQNFARYYPKRLPAEVLLDAIDTVTKVKTSFPYPMEMRTVDLPDEGVSNYFLDIFGRPARQSSCECERTNDANLSQALHLLNSPEIQGKLAAETGRAAQLAGDPRPHAEKIRDLYLLFFARNPTSDEEKTAVEYLNKQSDQAFAYQTLIWALINTKEFQFNT